MASVATELNIFRRKKGIVYCVNFISDDVTTATAIKTPASGGRIWIDKVVVTAVSAGTEWFKLFDDTDTLFGPIVTASGVPWLFCSKRGINLAVDAPLKVQTQSAIPIHVLVEGTVDTDPEVSESASPSSSPSPSE